MDFKLLIAALFLTIVASVPKQGFPGPVRLFVKKDQCEKKCTGPLEFCKNITNAPFMWECSDACTMCGAYGARVKRGPTWNSNDEDSCGGVAECAADGTCEGTMDRAWGYCINDDGDWIENCYLYDVQWDCGYMSYYIRQGADFCDVVRI